MLALLACLNSSYQTSHSESVYQPPYFPVIQFTTVKNGWVVLIDSCQFEKLIA